MGNVRSIDLGYGYVKYKTRNSVSLEPSVVTHLLPALALSASTRNLVIDGFGISRTQTEFFVVELLARLGEAGDLHRSVLCGEVPDYFRTALSGCSRIGMHIFQENRCWPTCADFRSSARTLPHALKLICRPEVRVNTDSSRGEKKTGMVDDPEHWRCAADLRTPQVASESKRAPNCNEGGLS